MGLRDLIKNGVALADKLTADLQPTVTHSAWIATTGTGKSVFGAPMTRAAIVERKQKLVKTGGGQELLSQHVVSFLRPVAPHGAAGRSEPIDARDRITLPDGTTGPILHVDTFVDRVTGAGYYHQVFLG